MAHHTLAAIANTPINAMLDGKQGRLRQQSLKGTNRAEIPALNVCHPLFLPAIRN